MLVRPAMKRLFCMKAKNGLIIKCENHNIQVKWNDFTFFANKRQTTCI